MVRRITCVCAALALCAAAQAQLDVGGFEAPAYVLGPLTDADIPPTGSGQNGWYLPVALSTPCDVELYGSDVWGFSLNPDGCSQFITGRNNGASPQFARAQHDVTFTAADRWTICFDLNPQFTGTPGEANDFLGSVSLQPSAAAVYFQTLYTWVDLLNPTNFDANMVYWDAAGVQVPLPGVPPGPEWTNLNANGWYRQSITIDFGTNQILSTSITDLATNVTTTVDTGALGWYMTGGASPTLPRPTAFRFFTGGGSGAGPAGNTIAWDNLRIAIGDECGALPQCPSTCDPCDTDCNGTVNGQDIDDFINILNGGPGCSPCAADADGNGSTNGQDIDDFIACLTP